MISFNLTKQMYETLSKAGAGMPKAQQLSSSWQWHAKIVKFGRISCVFAVEEESRYVIVMIGLKKADFKKFHELFIDHLEIHLRNLFLDSGDMVQDKLSSLISDLRADFSYFTPASRSVVSHMTQMQLETEIFCQKYLGGYLPGSMTDLLALCQYMNKHIRSHQNKNDYFYSSEVFKDKVIELLDQQFT